MRASFSFCLLVVTFAVGCTRVPRDFISPVAPKPSGVLAVYQPVDCPGPDGARTLADYERDDRYLLAESTPGPTLFHASGTDDDTGEISTNSWREGDDLHFFYGRSRTTVVEVVLDEAAGTGRVQVYFKFRRTGSKLEWKTTADGAYRPGDGPPASVLCLQRAEPERAAGTTTAGAAAGGAAASAPTPSDAPEAPASGEAAAAPTPSDALVAPTK